MSWQPPPGPKDPGSNPNSNPNPKPNTNQSSQSASQAAAKQTYYEILQVDPQSHSTIIRYAYRYLAGIYHPDNVETGNPEMFRLISDAFRTLADAGKRQAYDAQIGIKAVTAKQAAQQAQAPAAEAPKASVSWNEVELRLAVLQVLLQARRKRVQTGGASAKMLMDVLHVDMAEMEWVLWYLREKGFIERAEQVFMITVKGVDYLVDQLSKTQILDEKTSRASNLPATIS
jgi:pyruvate/2-oxoglutarate dehydrogenase complex dihydrolipoamide acyltransferase (E2) component